MSKRTRERRELELSKQKKALKESKSTKRWRVRELSKKRVLEGREGASSLLSTIFLLEAASWICEHN